ncbi:pep-cterm sorting domain-containing protein [Anaeramoeba flamelloides]|uniref:Pep-cterm sorting domain-containing protein n=1 Tax=Anaeramoeba flamelloides TaxID=1746091 RepID=A0AAV7YWP5_9EUKA|nr:pep-cterm sorting domain-containing protein [Anaeramoeba flamelloides]
MVGWSNYFVCKDGRLGDGTSNEAKNIPVLIFENVTRVFGGVKGYVTKEGKIYGCGGAGSNGFTQDKSTFTEIEEVKNKKVVEYFGSTRLSLALTSENELFGWGFDSSNHPTDQYQEEKLKTPHIHDLFNDEDSKDFTLLIKNDGEGEREDGDDDKYEEIPVHKIILLTRSGLFREMFQNITEESKSVKDYSGKSIESIEILIKYFYTGKIELTADHDSLLIIEELEDSLEYYQLNENSNIISPLNEIKNNL